MLNRAGNDAPIAVPPRPPRGKLESVPFVLACTEADVDGEDVLVEAPRPDNEPRARLESVPLALGTPAHEQDVPVEGD